MGQLDKWPRMSDTVSGSVRKNCGCKRVVFSIFFISFFVNDGKHSTYNVRGSMSFRQHLEYNVPC